VTDSEFHPSPLARLLNASWPLFRAFRVNVRVSWTIVIVPLVLAIPMLQWMPPSEAFAWAAGMTVVLYATTWTHEMGHITMGRRCGIESDRITLRATGGLAHMAEPAATPRDDILIALAGPATHLVWMAVLLPAAWLLEEGSAGTWWFELLRWSAGLQTSLLVFNLLPIWPMDGGRALRSALALRMDATKASYHVATLGFVGNGLLILAGLLSLFDVTDLRAFHAFGFLLVWIGLAGIQACRQLRLDARSGAIYGDRDPFQRTLVASQAAMREIDRDEQRERDERRAARDRRARLQETTDRLLDRINEVGGIENLPAKEREELERASRALAEEE
jgi:Zn-dependent protease